MQYTAKAKKVYTVGQINTLVKVALEEGLPSRFSVVGQISDYKRHFSGHCYFSLKDESGILPGVMWKGKAGKLKFEPENGLDPTSYERISALLCSLPQAMIIVSHNHEFVESVTSRRLRLEGGNLHAQDIASDEGDIKRLL